MDTPPVEDPRRLEILDAINRQIGSLPGTDGHADGAALVAFLLNIPEITDAGMADDTSVWAKFRDGRPLLIINNRSDAEPLALNQQSGSTAAASITASNEFALLSAAAAEPSRKVRPLVLGRIGLLATPTGLPGSLRAFLFEAHLPGLSHKTVDVLTPAFRDRKYAAFPDEASLDNFLSLTNYPGDIGVLYVDSHGGTGILQTVSMDVSTGNRVFHDDPFYGVTTSTTVTEKGEKDLKSLLDRLEIGYVTMGPLIINGPGRGTNPPPLANSRYIILPQFASSYWKFSQSSFVYMDTCHSGGPAAGSFMAACSTHGAAVYAGWSAPVAVSTSFDVAREVVDLLLGGSKIIPLNPPQRSFDLKSVVGYLSKSGDDTDPHYGARLQFYRSLSAPTDFGMLAPSIQSMRTDERTGQLHIYGLFDPTVSATVRIEGDGTKEIEAMPSILAGLDLYPDPAEIVCPLPADQSPSAGNVTVIQRGHPSNTVPLSQWRMSGQCVRYFSATDDTGPTATYQFDLRLRADVHSIRRAPYGISKFEGASATAAKGSTASLIAAGGIYYDPNGLRTVEYQLRNPGPLQLSDDAVSNTTTAFSGSIRFSPDGSIYFVVNASAIDGITVIETNKKPSGGADVFQTPFNPFTRTFDGHGKNGTMNLTSYTIENGDGSNAGDAGRTTWTTSNPTFPPKPSIPGYAE
ncbi:MAG: hypothetical protein U1G07_19945 [Verrucomicrobiota bacterium]